MTWTLRARRYLALRREEDIDVAIGLSQSKDREFLIAFRTRDWRAVHRMYEEFIGSLQIDRGAASFADAFCSWSLLWLDREVMLVESIEAAAPNLHHDLAERGINACRKAVAYANTKSLKV
jgi:hypothetical protein